MWSDQDLVVTTSRGTPINRNNYRRSLRDLCMKAEILPPITPYELRRTAIGHQADQDHSSWQIADWAGTSERMISERYRHKLRGVAQLGPIRFRILIEMPGVDPLIYSASSTLASQRVP